MKITLYISFLYICSRMPTLLVTDSRGKGLQKRFDHVAPGVVTVVVKKGADLYRLFSTALKRLSQGHYNVLIISGGICSVTALDDRRKARLRYETVEELLETVKKIVRMCVRTMKKDFPKVKLILTPTVGIDMARYNKEPTPKKTQKTMNYMVTALNGLLTHSNDKGTPIPWISGMVHACKGNGGWSHKYKHLKDGCHYGHKMKDFVVKQISKTLLKL